MTGTQAIKERNLGLTEITDHKGSNRNESTAHPSDISAFYFLLSFLRCTFSHQRTKRSPPFAARAALSYTSSMVNSTWKEKHHVVQLDARFVQILTCTQESWKMSFMCCFSPLSSLVGNIFIRSVKLSHKKNDENPN